MKIEDLDILRPEKRIIKLDGKDIDVSFIPCGINFEVDEIVRELGGMSTEIIGDNNTGSKRAYELSIKLCSLFVENKYPELDEDWFKANVDAIQIKHFVEAIKDALTKAYLGVETETKNLKAAKRKSK